jgi:pullulanase/glycogen debranching enzyme
MLNKSVLLTILVFFNLCIAQIEFTPEEKLQGYKQDNNTIYFVFDEKLYDVQPEKVVIEGSFRNWDHNMDDTRWWLKKEIQESIWILKAPQSIESGSQFKFRINNGDWMAPPAGAINLRGGNLIFGDDSEKIKMKAEIVGEFDVRLFISGKDITISLDPNDYRLKSSENTEILIKKVFYIRPGEIQLYPVNKLDKRRVYTVENLRDAISSVASYDGWFRHTYSAKKLGAFFDTESNQTWFRLFAPRSTQVILFLYNDLSSDSYAQHILEVDINGVWEVALPGNLEGIYYDYTVGGFDEMGNNFYDTNPVHISDPYGQVSVDSFGPCRVWPNVAPPRPLKNGRPPLEDVIAYEVHIQDFTAGLPIDDSKKGSFTGFIEKNLTNNIGEKIGFDHILDLGVNVVHLQPIQEFLHFPTEAWQATFLNDPYMIEQGINQENYQWGYRITHFMAIESRYREKGTPWGFQNQQFRDLVEAFHDAGIAVIVDMVFNHSGERMDGRMDFFNFSVIDKPYYYRTDESYNYIGDYGTELKSEERPMVQRWIIDQCKNLINQYGVDGFRIDLAGLTDKQTLLTLRQELGKDIIIYGEPWISSSDLNYEENPDWNWYKIDAPITFFQDDARNAFKGSPFTLENKLSDRGYAGGNGDRENVKQALSAGFPEDHTPISGINYLDIHDNWALADRFASSEWDGRNGVDENRVKIAAALLFTSLGPVVIHGGTEFLRSKGHAPLKELKKKFQDGYLAFHGKNDTYNLAKANEYIWENKGKSIGDDNNTIKCNYKNMYAYWRGLIQLRNSDIGKVFRHSEKPPVNYYKWFEPDNPRLLGYTVSDQIFVLMNTDTTDGLFENVILPENSNWQLIANINEINPVEGISGAPNSTLIGGKYYDLTLPAESLKIWVNVFK